MTDTDNADDRVDIDPEPGPGIMLDTTADTDPPPLAGASTETTAKLPGKQGWTRKRSKQPKPGGKPKAGKSSKPGAAP